MPLILGIVASGNYPRVTNSYESIATANGTGSSNTISFTSIPSTYKHLQLRWLGTCDASGATETSVYIQANSLGSGNYFGHRLIGDGSAASSSYVTSSAEAGIYVYAAAGGASTSAYGAMVLDVLDYQNTNKYKTFRTLSGCDVNGGGRISFGSGAVSTTSAITRLDIVVVTGSWTANSKFALYGIKG